MIGAPDAYVKVGYFENRADLLYQDEVHGPLITMADRVEELVYSKYFKGIISYQGIQRIETFPVPRTAFREAMLNAIIHRDYTTGNPIHVHIYPDEILIYNDGRLPDHWTVDDLFVPHSSKPHNPFIAGAFFRSGQIEAWGRGVEKITASRKAWNQPAPFYRVRPNEVMIGFSVDTGGAGNTEDVVRNVVTNVARNVVRNGVELDEVNAKILGLMHENPQITAKTIAETLGITSRHVQRSIKFLKDNGLIERVGATKKGHWVVKPST